MGAIICYDVTDEYSFERVERWISDVRNTAGEDVNIILVGNKIDMGPSRKISTREGIQTAKAMNINFLETSAKTGHNVIEAFSMLLEGKPNIQH